LVSDITKIDSITRIYSHSQSLAQCRKWLDSRYPKAERIAVSSNAEAARCAAEDEGAAAIAGEKAAEIYALEILASNIEDESDNTTRFIVIGAKDVGSTGNDKTALLVSTKNKPGALQELLKPLADSGISMTRIESRPSGKGIWEYVFFIDIEGHSQDSKVEDALNLLKKESSMCRVLGSYPKAVL